MKTTVLTLEVHDDLISIRDKLAWAKSPRILLVWPRRRIRRVEAPLVLSRLDLILLARHARSLGAQLALVSSNARVRVNAGEAGVPVFDSAEDAQDASWRRLRRRRWSRVRRKPAQVASQTLDGEQSQALPEWREQRKQFFSPQAPAWMRNPASRVGIFSLGVLAVLAVAFLFIPHAKIRLAAVQQTQQVRLAIWASPQVTQVSVTGALPARIESVSVEGQDALAASGSAWIPETYAVGQVLLTNLGNRPVILPEGTLLRTADEGEEAVRFELTREVRLPAQAGATAQGSLQALNPGSRGNVAAGAIISVEGALGNQVGVDQPQATAGGSERRVPAPTEEDYRKLYAQTLESLSQTALEEMAGKLGEGELVITASAQAETIELAERVPPAGGAGDNLILTLRVQFTAWVVRSADIEQLAGMVLQATMPGGYRAAWAAPVYQLEREFSLEGTRATALLSTSWNIEPDYSSLEVALTILGKTPQQAEDLLYAQLALEESPSIEMQPAWWPVLPLLPSQIQVFREDS